MKSQGFYKSASTERGASKRRIDYTGHRFGFLTAVRFDRCAGRSVSYWVLRCDCGTEISRQIRQCVAGWIKSCGCKKREMLQKANRLPNHQALKNTAYAVHCKAARNRSYRNDLTKEQYVEIISKPCHYCGGFSVRKNVSGDTASLNSVDRRDSEPFYSISNSVPCCFVCQKMKGAYTEAQFLEQTRKVTGFRSS